MKTDFYTKTVLTVIATALIILVLENTNLIPKAEASTNLHSNYATVPVNQDGSINVKIDRSSTLDVNIESINGTLANYPLYVTTITLKKDGTMYAK